MLGYKNQNSSYRSSLIKGNEQSPVEWGIRVNRNLSHPSKSNKKKQGQIQRRKDRKFELPSYVD